MTVAAGATRAEGRVVGAEERAPAGPLEIYAVPAEEAMAGNVAL